MSAYVQAHQEAGHRIDLEVSGLIESLGDTGLLQIAISESREECCGHVDACCPSNWSLPSCPSSLTVSENISQGLPMGVAEEQDSGVVGKSGGQDGGGRYVHPARQKQEKLIGGLTWG